jgi:hypothetical protein
MTHLRQRMQAEIFGNYGRRGGLKDPEGSRRVILNPGKFEDRLLGPTITFNQLRVIST